MGAAQKLIQRKFEKFSQQVEDRYLTGLSAGAERRRPFVEAIGNRRVHVAKEVAATQIGIDGVPPGDRPERFAQELTRALLDIAAGS